jgi:hypothetical protein
MTTVFKKVDSTGDGNCYYYSLARGLLNKTIPLKDISEDLVYKKAKEIKKQLVLTKEEYKQKVQNEIEILGKNNLTIYSLLRSFSIWIRNTKGITKKDIQKFKEYLDKQKGMDEFENNWLKYLRKPGKSHIQLFRKKIYDDEKFAIRVLKIQKQDILPDSINVVYPKLGSSCYVILKSNNLIKKNKDYTFYSLLNTGMYNIIIKKCKLWATEPTILKSCLINKVFPIILDNNTNSIISSLYDEYSIDTFIQLNNSLKFYMITNMINNSGYQNDIQDFILFNQARDVHYDNRSYEDQIYFRFEQLPEILKYSLIIFLLLTYYNSNIQTKNISVFLQDFPELVAIVNNQDFSENTLSEKLMIINSYIDSTSDDKLGILALFKQKEDEPDTFESKLNKIQFDGFKKPIEIKTSKKKEIGKISFSFI